ncbi:hypothetical protein Q3G72_010772 [Acer saccharum]|nr:hypothetical protein Q3G72_010772 [Acer saccharum]
MLRDRGYDVSDSELALSLSLAEFRSIFGDKPDPERLRFYFPLRSNPTKKMLVMFLGTDQVKTKDIREMFMQIVNRESLQGLILILQSKVTAYAKKEMEKFSFKVELFQITDLLVNITKHILTPKYEILNAAKKHNILKKYEVEEKQVDSVTIIVTIINIGHAFDVLKFTVPLFHMHNTEGNNSSGMRSKKNTEAFS